MPGRPWARPRWESQRLTCNVGRMPDRYLEMDPTPPADLADPAARFTALFDAHASDVLSYLLRRVPERADAADILADTFLVAWRRVGEVPAGDAARPWLFGVARLTLQNARRGRLRSVGLAERLRDELIVHPPVMEPLETSAIELAQAMEQLRKDDREVLLLVGWDGLAPEDAAVVLGVTAGATRVRLHRARRRLRDLLESSPPPAVEKQPAVVRTRGGLKGTPALPGLEEV